MATERKLDLFKTLGNISKKNIDYFKTLSDEEKKDFIPFVVARWLSGTSNPRQIYFLNVVVNPFTFVLGQQHKELLYYLMTACATGKSQKYFWNKLPSKTTTAKPNAVRVVADYFDYSMRHAVEAIKVLTVDDVLRYAGDLGRQPEEIAKIKREFKQDVQE